MTTASETTRMKNCKDAAKNEREIQWAVGGIPLFLHQLHMTTSVKKSTAARKTFRGQNEQRTKVKKNSKVAKNAKKAKLRLC